MRNGQSRSACPVKVWNRELHAQLRLSTYASSPTDGYLVLIQVLKVHVLAVSLAFAKYLYVYTATIPLDFLDKFDEPFRYSPSCPIKVNYHRITILRAYSWTRLHRILCTGKCSYCITKT